MVSAGLSAAVHWDDGSPPRALLCAPLTARPTESFAVLQSDTICPSQQGMMASSLASFSLG
jgi:hypothetical protein